MKPLSRLYAQAFLQFEDSSYTKKERIKRLENYFLNIQSTLDRNNGFMTVMTDSEAPNEFLAFGSCYELSEDKTDTNDKCAHISEIFVNPKFQGMGYGDKILDNLLELASAKYENSEWIDLNAISINHKALKLYEKHGFKVKFKNEHPRGFEMIRLAKPLHDDFAFHIYPRFNPDNPKNPGIPDYYTESAAYPVLRYAKYTKKIYGEMIRFQYGVYEDDQKLTKKAVNGKAKRDAITLLSGQEKDPKNFIVWCAITEVSIAAYIVMSRDANGIWNFTMDHYYDTDESALKKLVEIAIEKTKLDFDPKVVYAQMIEKDNLRGESKTKYRSTFNQQEYKGEITDQLQKQDKGEDAVDDDNVPESKTEIPNSSPEEPPLAGMEFEQKKKSKKTPSIKNIEMEPEDSELLPEVPTEIPNSKPEEPIDSKTIQNTSKPKQFPITTELPVKPVPKEPEQPPIEVTPDAPEQLSPELPENPEIIPNDSIEDYDTTFQEPIAQEQDPNETPLVSTPPSMVNQEPKIEPTPPEQDFVPPVPITNNEIDVDDVPKDDTLIKKKTSSIKNAITNVSNENPKISMPIDTPPDIMQQMQEPDPIQIIDDEDLQSIAVPASSMPETPPLEQSADEIDKKINSI